MTAMISENYLPNVRAQYEELPYPLRNPEEEKTKLKRTIGDDLQYLNHFGFGGKMPLQGLRVLDAGGGSGDGSTYMAEQLRDYGGHVVHLDLSTASIEVARERTRIRQLENIEYIHASLLDLPNLGLEPFDYIMCTGVLHHLADPVAGLNALKSALKPEGLIKIMVYGQYGRTWVYHMQELMRRMNADIAPDDVEAQLANAKDMMALLKGTKWFTQLEQSVNDIASMGDVGIYDLFLHSQDRAYTIPELYEYVESCELQLNHYIIDPHLLNPARLKPSATRQVLLEKPVGEQQAIMELMVGSIKKHFCYASHAERKPATAEDEAMVPFFGQFIPGIEKTIRNAVTYGTDGEIISLKADGHTLNLTVTPSIRALVNAIDDERSIQLILDKASEQTGGTIDRSTLKADLMQLLNSLIPLEWALLRHSSIAPFPTRQAMQARVSETWST